MVTSFRLLCPPPLASCQIDGSTLRTICMQHGPLLTFHLGLTQGSALIRYSSRQEAAKAQGALHMWVILSLAHSSTVSATQ